MRALVVGYGRMGRFHAHVLDSLGFHVVTADPAPGADYSSAYDVVGRIDVVAISTPPEHLADVALAFAGTPMLVEKPFALDERSAVELASAVGDRTCVGFVERFNPVVQKLRRCPVPGLERVVFTRQSERETPDVMLDLGVHDFDLAHYLDFPLDLCEFRPSYGGTERTITVFDDLGETVYDLRAHCESPLHALWREFLAGGDYPTPRDAIRALGRSESSSHLTAALTNH